MPMPSLARLLVLCCAVCMPPLAFAQQSASHSISDATLNAGGSPRDGTALVSASHQVTLSSLGGFAARRGLQSASNFMDGGFVSGYVPATEVHGVSWLDHETMQWSAHVAAGDYAVYRDSLAALAAGDYGDCHTHDISSTSVYDTDLPPAGSGFFYLVSVENRLEEEGTLGSSSTGDERVPAAECP